MRGPLVEQAPRARSERTLPWRATRRGALHAGGALVAASPLRAHPVHTSDMELRYDAPGARIEVALRVWERDLEGALGASGGNARPGRPLLTWLQRSVRFYPDAPRALSVRVGKGQSDAPSAPSPRTALTDWSWVGEEKTPHGQWLYFTVAAPTRALAVQSHLFFGYTKKQINTVRAGARTLLFASDDVRTHAARSIPWAAGVVGAPSP